MALSMSRPWKHPDSGFYWFRKRVPDDLGSLLGKREERFSLGTRDPIEAKRLHVLKLAEVEERWSKTYAEFLKKYLPAIHIDDNTAIPGYINAYMIEQVLKRCGDELTRENSIETRDIAKKAKGRCYISTASRSTTLHGLSRGS